MITWYLTRGVGGAALVLLTGSVALGVADVARLRSRRYPRFVVDDVHRAMSVAALLLVCVHVVVSVLDTFAPVRLTDAFVPFAGSYRPIWLGLGALSFDLLLLLVVSSILRKQIGYRTWRAIHWAAWACWPVALVHSFGTGSDVKHGWMLALGIGCSAVVAIAVGVRVMGVRGPGAARVRLLAVGGSAAGAIALALWLPAGPLGKAWALRSGTPAGLLAFKPTTVAAVRTAPRVTPARNAVAVERAFAAEGSGTIREGTTTHGTTLVDIALHTDAPESRYLDIRIAGYSDGAGGVQMTRSQVTFGPRTDPARYVGRLTSLAGTQMTARLTPLHGRALTLRAALALAGGRAHGRVEVRPL